MTSRIYLAGPISGLLYNESTDWRTRVASALPGIECLSPLRFKTYLDTNEIIRDSYDQEAVSPLSTGRGIMTRDFFDCNRADLVIANLLDLKKVSIGTAMEIAWTYAKHTPLIAIMEPNDNLMDHAMIREAIGFRVETEEAAIEVARAILLV